MRERRGEVGGHDVDIALTDGVDDGGSGPVEQMARQLEHLHQTEVTVHCQAAE